VSSTTRDPSGDATLDVVSLRVERPGVANVLHFKNADMALPPRRVLEAVTGHLVREAEIGGMAAMAKALAPPRTRGVLRDEVVAEQKIVYLRNVRQGSSGLEGEACSTLPMSSQRR
jgi:hypothetical protein